MSLQMSYNDRFGNTLPASYWTVDEVQYIKTQKKVRFTMSCYVDGSSKTANKEPISSRKYVSDASEWLTYFDHDVLDSLDKNITKACYELAKNRQDTIKSGYTVDGDNNYYDANGNPVTFAEANRSFFEGAIDV